MSDTQQQGTGRETQAVVLTDYERELRDRIFANPSDWPDSAKVWIADYVSQNSLLPISQVQGFTQFVTQYAEVVAAETTSSTTYTDLATVGPTISGLSAGQYVIIFSASLNAGAPAKGAYAALSINGAPAGAAPVLVYFIPGGVSSWGGGVTSVVKYQSFSTGNNSLKMQYSVDSGATGMFSNRSIIAIRVGNP